MKNILRVNVDVVLCRLEQFRDFELLEPDGNSFGTKIEPRFAIPRGMHDEIAHTSEAFCLRADVTSPAAQTLMWMLLRCNTPPTSD